MSNYTIENWFPKPIYYADNVCVEHLPLFETKVKNIIETKGTKTTGYLGVKSTHQTDSELHLDPMFRPLCRDISEHVFNFATTLGYSPDKAFKMSFGNMWANLSGQHGYNFPHTHPGSVISGAFYIKTAPGNTIAFYDKYEVIALPEGDTLYNGAPITYGCVPGRLLLFKSDFIHGNPAQESVGEKIVISFNMVF
jgi:uncharacterized protein (TIGR02466 family)